MSRSVVRMVGVFLAAWLASTEARAQVSSADPELGRPHIRNWTMRDYDAFPQNWVVCHDVEGRIYVGNRDGVLMYDGQRWRTLPVPGAFIRGLDFAPDGRLYVGGVDQLGYFERTPLGEWGPFVSMLNLLPPEERAMGDIRSVDVLTDGVYFVSSRRVIRWHEGRFTVRRFEGGYNVFSYRVGDRLYLHRLGEPLQVMVGDDVTVAADLPDLRQARLAGVLPWENGSLLLAWPSGRIAILRDGMLTPWAAAAQTWLGGQVISRVRRLDAQHIAVMTERAGVALFDTQGNFIQKIDQAAGLYNAIVRDVMRDNEGGLWFAMNHGVAHVDALAGISFFDSQNGLGRSTVRTVVRHQGVLYATTAEGLYRLRPAHGDVMAAFEFVKGSEADSLALYSHPSGLLVGTSTGIYLYPESGGDRVKVSTLGCYQLRGRPGQADALWATGMDGVYPLRYADGKWQTGPRLPGIAAETRTLAELPDGSLWASTPTRGLLRWVAPAGSPPTAAEVYHESGGLPKGAGWMRVDRWDDALMGSSCLGLFRWNGAANRFEPFAVTNATPGEGSLNIYGGDPRYVWSFFGKDRRTAHVVRIAEDHRLEALPQTLVQAIGDVETMWREVRDGRDILWVGGSYGLARVDVNEAFRAPASFRTIIGSIGRSREPQIKGGSFIWPHGAADLSIAFAAATYRSGANLQFQNRLEGYDDDWSAWSPADSREFTNLSAGRYTLRVKARDADGRIGEEASFAFAVLPPWWQTRWAFAAYALGLVAGVTAIVRWRVSASERERERLQKLVAERTCQLVESQDNLRQAAQAAEAANRAKTAFLASMSHELRTPLNSVLGYAQILRRSPEVGPTARRSIETIQRSGDHLLHLINEVLDLAKIEAGRVELHEAPFELERFAHSITELFAVRTSEKGLAFSGPDVSKLPVTVRGDESRLRQVIVNLLGNAFKFTDRGRVAWSITPLGPGQWRFEVTDTGIGIPEAERKKVFEPFYQSAARPVLAQQGTGLGLSISVHLVQLMGGRLQLDSEVGEGSRFWFDLGLPVVEAHAAAVSSDGEQPVIVGYAGRRRRLLVVDDEAANRAVLDEMLSPLGFVIEEANSAKAAREAVARQAPDAVLLDLRMPGDDGFVLAREWRTNGLLRGAKVLALSASVLPEQQTDAITAGCDAFLAKPFREEQLLRVIGSLLGLEWLDSGEPAKAATAADSGAAFPLRWEAGLLQRLLQLAENGDALRLGNELAELARRGAAWAAVVAPWQKLALGYQMEALSRALEDTLQREVRAPVR